MSTVGVNAERPATQRPLNLGFAGTPEFAAVMLQSLLGTEHQIAVVLSQPDRPTGRGRKLRPSPVKALALAHGLAVLDPPGLKNTSLAEHGLDLLIVAAYGLILPPHILAEPRLGCLNVHASLLPRWRGAAPVERAIMAGDPETGVCLMQMDAGLDTGPVFACERLQIGERDTGGQLEARLAAAGARLLVANLPIIESLTAVAQPETGITYAHKLTAADSRLDWALDAPALARQVRALTDRQPLTVYCTPERDGPNVRVRLLMAVASAEQSGAEPGTILAVDDLGLQVACREGTLHVETLQLNRGKGTPMSARAAANGFPHLLAPGRQLFAEPPQTGG